MLLAALFLAAPASAQEPSARPQAAALDPGNTQGLKPFEIACKITNEDGESQEIAVMTWHGGAIPVDFCPPGATLMKYYAAEIVAGHGKSSLPETKAGGDD